MVTPRLPSAVAFMPGWNMCQGSASTASVVPAISISRELPRRERRHQFT